MAAEMAAGRSAGETDWILEAAVAWCTGGAGVADRSTEIQPDDTSRCAPLHDIPEWAFKVTQGVEPARRSDALYDAACGMAGVAVPLQSADGHRRRHDRRQSYPQRT